MNFQQAHAYLDSLQLHKIKLGLDSMKKFLEKVGHPESKLNFVHIAGTNGKGSVSVNIVSVLSRAGYNVGLFTSPHLSSVRERFRINDQFISEEEFARLATKVRDVLGEDMVTYFEFTTALALLWFEEKEVDLVVLETGLGGRLDATNVAKPLVTVITNVSMDHEAYLGDDLRSIAYEKAGIIKKNIPLVTGVADDDSREVVLQRCNELGVKCLLYGRDFGAEDKGKSWNFTSNSVELGIVSYENLICGMKGDYQKSNSSLAIGTLLLLKKSSHFSFSEDELREGIKSVHWPGRLEYLELDQKNRDANDTVRYLIDGAHNPAGVASLVKTLKEEYQYEKLVVVWGAMEDKDLRLTVPAIGHMASTIILTKPEGERAADPDELLAVLPEQIRQRCKLIPDVQEALLAAEESSSAKDMIVVAGSLYLIGEVRKYLVGELVE